MSECRLSPRPSVEPRRSPQHDINELVSAEDGIVHTGAKRSCAPTPGPLRRERHGAITGPGTTVADDVYPAGPRSCGIVRLGRMNRLTDRWKMRLSST